MENQIRELRDNIIAIFTDAYRAKTEPAIELFKELYALGDNPDLEKKMLYRLLTISIDG